MPIVKCEQCKTSYDLRDQLFHYCGCGQGFGSVSCSSCQKDNVVWFDLQLQYEHQFTCCGNTQVLTPCLECCALNLRQINQQSCICACGYKTMVLRCRSCGVNQGVGTRGIFPDGASFTCQLGCPADVLMKCSDCRKYEVTASYRNFGRKCTLCQAQSFRLYCTGCKTFKDYGKDFKKPANKKKACSCGTMIQLDSNVTFGQKFVGSLSNPTRLENFVEKKVATTAPTKVEEPKQAIDLSSIMFGDFGSLMAAVQETYQEMQSAQVQVEPKSEPPLQQGEIDRTSFDCSKCQSPNSIIILYPCGHDQLCGECTNDLTYCPLCNEEIRSRIINVHRRNYYHELVEYIKNKQNA